MSWRHSACLVGVLAAVISCGRSERATPAATAAGSGGSAAASVERQSVGWQTSSAVPDPPSDVERAKLDRVGAAEPGTTVPVELAQRATLTLPTSLDVYVDGTSAIKLPLTQVKAGLPLVAAIGDRPVRGVFVRGEAQNLWIAGAEVSSYALRVNRRGKIKLERVAGESRRRGKGDARGGRHDEPGAPRPPAMSRRDEREQQVRGVLWLEVRTPESPRLTGEPP